MEETLKSSGPSPLYKRRPLSKSIGELREALGDDPRSPKLIVTVHRRGFRFVGRLPTEAERRIVPVETAAPPPAGGPTTDLFVGRDVALGRLRLASSQASNGARRLVFVSGEPGIGKSTLVEPFRVGWRRSLSAPRS